MIEPNAVLNGSLQVVVLWITFAQQNHKAATYKLSSARSARVAALC
jgi:hypothetical protein